MGKCRVPEKVRTAAVKLQDPTSTKKEKTKASNTMNEHKKKNH